jgi:tRNA threonylcarbamoyladenosine modification (KEOPS) complex Cgi121 subunit
MVSLRSLKSDEQRANELLARPAIQQRIKELKEGARLLGLSKKEHLIVIAMKECPELCDFICDQFRDEFRALGLEEESKAHLQDGNGDRQ